MFKSKLQIEEVLKNRNILKTNWLNPQLFETQEGKDFSRFLDLLKDLRHLKDEKLNFDESKAVTSEFYH